MNKGMYVNKNKVEQNHGVNFVFHIFFTVQQ